jgi:hypothetical protein
MASEANGSLTCATLVVVIVVIVVTVVTIAAFKLGDVQRIAHRTRLPRRDPQRTVETAGAGLCVLGCAAP